MKVYTQIKAGVTGLYLVLNNPGDKQVALKLNASIIKNNLGVVYIDNGNVEYVIEMLIESKATADKNTFDYLKQALSKKQQKKDKLINEKNNKKKKILKGNSPIYDRASFIKKRLLDKDVFNDYSSLNSALLPHQKAGALISKIFNRYAFYYDTGTGKTVLALEIITQKESSERISFLIICPKTIIKNAWLSDAEKFYPHLKILPLSKNIQINDYKRIYRRWNEIDKGIPVEKIFIHGDEWERGSIEVRQERVKKKLMDRAKHFIVNPEMFKRDIDFYNKLNVNGLIVDESAILKDYYSKISSEVRKYSSNIKYVYFLSGKPAPNNSIEYFPQMKIITPKIFSMSFDSYKKKYYLDSPYERTTKLSFKSKACKDEVATLIGANSITLSKEECLILPEKTYQVRTIGLEGRIMDAYRSMLWHYYAEIMEKEKLEGYVSVTSKLASLMKLRQITSGFIIKDDVPHHLHDQKENELVNLLYDIGQQQVIIWCQFKYEINRLLHKIKSLDKSVVTAFGETKDVDESINKFKNGQADYMIAHPRTLQYGVTLTNCSYSIYYSMSYSHEEYYQSHDRIYRKGQVNKCTYMFIQAENTIDELIFDVVQNKKTQTALFEMLVKDAEKIGLKYFS